MRIAGLKRVMSGLGARVILLASVLAAGADGEEPQKPASEISSNYWALNPPVPPTLPSVKHKSWLRSPIDYFILERLEQKGLLPAPPAEKATLLRRATFDLLGLPPKPEELDAFLA